MANLVKIIQIKSMPRISNFFEAVLLTIEIEA